MRYKKLQYKNKATYEHTIKAEIAIGRKLKQNEIVHHLDGNALNNNNENLVIIERSMHQFLHKRLRGFKVSGNKDYRQCRYCMKYEDQKNMLNYSNRSYHRTCENNYRKSLIKKEDSCQSASSLGAIERPSK